MTRQRFARTLTLLQLFALIGCADASDGRDARVAGQLWRSTYSTREQHTVTETVSRNGSVTRRGAGAGIPWPDGKQFATHDWDGTSSVVRVFDTVRGTQLHEIRRSALMTTIKPSPSAQLLALRVGHSTLGPFDWIVYDLAHGRELKRFQAFGAGFTWTSERNFMIVDEDGSVREGSSDGAVQRIGRVPLPEGRHVGDAWLSPDGTALLLRLDLRPTNGARESDLWILRRGTRKLERFTSTKMTTFAAWSPDGTRIAFNVDTGAWCAGSFCTGICEVWHASAAARNIRSPEKSVGISSFSVRTRDGESSMQCELEGWTR